MEGSTLLQGFAYGEEVDGVGHRSLGYRLLVPAEAWGEEIEALAHGLQAAAYPDTWQPCDLFCSVLLSEGGRLIASVRYGLVDHTPARRRGGLEMVGVVGPGSLGVPSAFAVYRWLKQRRERGEELHAVGGRANLSEVLEQVPPSPLPREAVPVLPVKSWRDGVLLFAAGDAADPDRRIALLARTDASDWQWLPFVGPDFSLAGFASRGPLIAWMHDPLSVASPRPPSGS